MQYNKNWVCYQLLVYSITELSFNNQTKLLLNKFGNAQGPPYIIHHGSITESESPVELETNKYPELIPNLLDQNLQW